VKPNVAISRDGKSMTVRVPLTVKTRGSRKLIIVPNGSDAWKPPPPQPNNAILKALGRAWRWKQMIESGEYATLAELAKAEGVNFSYLCRVMRLTLLSPNAVAAILDGRQRHDLQLQDLLTPSSALWEEQDKMIC